MRLKELGRGSYARVYQVQSRENNKIFALKEVNLQDTGVNPIKNEFYSSAIVQCTNLVQCYALYCYDSNFAILQELMWGNLTNFVAVEKSLNEETIAYIMRETLKGLEFLHSNHSIHRDLKCDNIFISFEGSVKIGDFGLSAQLTRERSDRETFAGSPLWMAPEILGGEVYGVASDVWSLGVTCYEIAVGRNPYIACKSLASLKVTVKDGPEPRLNGDWSPDFREFIELCLQKTPDRRKTCSELLNCQFLSNIDENSARNCVLGVIQRPIV